MSTNMEGPKMGQGKNVLDAVMARVGPRRSPSVPTAESPVGTKGIDPEEVKRIAKVLFNGDTARAEAFCRRPVKEILPTQQEAPPPVITAAASKRASLLEARAKKKPREFAVFIEKSLPSRDKW